LVLIMDDPDVPEYIRKDRMWVHWVLYDLDPHITGIEEGVLPKKVTLGKGTGGDIRYRGPCPPDREHRYFFKLYALDCMLNLERGAEKQEVEKAMEGHILAHAEFIGRYDRKR